MNPQPLPLSPVALTIAGSDSGGNAGVQADLRAFHVFGVHGCTVFTALTAQNPSRVAGVLAVPPEFARLQIETVFAEYAVAAVKTGMLANAAIIRAVASALACHGRNKNLVVDPVMVATSGARLLEPEAEQTLAGELLPLARLATPNLPEAALLLGRPVAPGDAPDAARELHARLKCAVLLKGGHNPAEAESMVDVLCDGSACWGVKAPRVANPASLHGTGCSLSAAIAAALAQGKNLLDAVREARAYVHASICTGRRVGANAAVLGTPEKTQTGLGGPVEIFEHTA